MPAWFRPIWNVGFALVYGVLRIALLLVFRPYCLVRRVGPRPPLPEGGWILCANHASYLDPVFLQLVVHRRVVFVMTNDFYSRRWGRWFFRLVGAIPVGSGRLAREGLEKMVRHLRQGQPLAIFPEGRLSTDGTLSEPQRGVAMIARMGQASILPAGIYGNLRAWPKGTRWMRRSDVRIAFGPLMPPPAAYPPPGRQEERAYAARIMIAVAEARERARLAGRGAHP
jgi:1-acyl-sn-glycerol-3-phosphate acyltransferase